MVPTSCSLTPPPWVGRLGRETKPSAECDTRRQVIVMRTQQRQVPQNKSSIKAKMVGTVAQKLDDHHHLGRWQMGNCVPSPYSDGGCALQFELTTLHIISFLTLIINLGLQDDSEISLF